MARLRLLSVAVAVLSACTASWNAVVRYSDEPAPSDESAAAEVYRAVLLTLIKDGWPRMAVLTDSTASLGSFAAVTTLGQPRLPGDWPDTLKREVRAALQDPQLAHVGDRTVILQAAMGIRFHLIAPTDSLASPHAPSSRLQLPPRLQLSAPGFNADTTIAAIHLDYWCGLLCGHGATLLLARRPGFRWRVWNYEVHWVS